MDNPMGTRISKMELSRMVEQAYAAAGATGEENRRLRRENAKLKSLLKDVQHDIQQRDRDRWQTLLLIDIETALSEGVEA